MSKAPEQALAPFRALLSPPRAHELRPGSVHEIDIAETTIAIHPDLPAVRPGVLVSGATSPLEVAAGAGPLAQPPAGVGPPSTPARPPITTAVVADPNGDVDSVQNYLGSQGGAPEDTSRAPIGWTAVHLHGAPVPSDADGWPTTWRRPAPTHRWPVIAPFDRGRAS